MKKTQILLSITLLLIVTMLIVNLAGIASAGVTIPRPIDIQLTPGQSSQFSFQIQQMANYDVICVYQPQDLQGLEITLDKQQYEVKSGTMINVIGKVKLPSSAQPGNYEANFCIECTPAATEGSTVKQRICGLPVTVEAVSERTRTNKYDVKEVSLLWLIILLLLIILVVVLLIVRLLKKQKKR